MSERAYGATIEVDGKVYALASATIEACTSPHWGGGWAVRELPWAAVTTSDMEVVRMLQGKGPQPCRVNFGGAVYAGTTYVMAWSHSDSEVILRVEGLEAIAFRPALDETTAPADVKWGEVRSAVAAKDWRRAWEVVGTDHTGEATPGEAYIFGNARRVSATTAALLAWRHVEMPLRMALINERHERGTPPDLVRNGLRNLANTESWQRIKRIAAWESSAAAQHVAPHKRVKPFFARLSERVFIRPLPSHQAILAQIS